MVVRYSTIYDCYVLIANRALADANEAIHEKNFQEEIKGHVKKCKDFYTKEFGELKDEIMVTYSGNAIIRTYGLHVKPNWKKIEQEMTKFDEFHKENKK
tara:strand:- start:238 stop:534 length:297 start_codon:yes stop_codon:yes gene_type:complete